MSAYACEPGKGSEPGAGWNWSRAASRDHDVWVLTRANNRQAIEAALAQKPEPRLTFVYLDLPGWACRWKRGGRGIRLYYVLWQIAAVRAARKLHRHERFDLVHHLTFANLWVPALTCLVPAPFVLGPVGGGPTVPLRLYRALGVRGAAHELLLRAARRASRLNPLVRIGWQRAHTIICQNDETLASLPAQARRRAWVRTNACVDRPAATSTVASRTAVCAGRLLPWKGIALAIEAVALAPDWKLTIIGRGPDEERLRGRVAALGLCDRVEFVPWVPQQELAERLSGVGALVLPSLREDGSLVSAEAQALGVPVIALDRGGPRVLARRPGTSIRLVRCGSHAETVRGMADALVALESTPVVTNAEFGLAGIADHLAHVYGRTWAMAGETAGAIA
jgi:glycosyltransferase involved in cell wall biosynthesis